MSETVKYVLDEQQIPKQWYNIVADLPEPPPPVLHPGRACRSVPTTSHRFFPWL